MLFVDEVNLDLLKGWLVIDWVILKLFGFGFKVMLGFWLIIVVFLLLNIFGLGVFDDFLILVLVFFIDRLFCSFLFVWVFCFCDFDCFFCGKKDGEKLLFLVNFFLCLVIFWWDIGLKVF